MIKKSSIENLKHHVDLYQLVSDYVSLQRSGSSWKGLSPFSQEKTPSFHVYPDRGFYYCFSTSQGGDAIKFLQVKENFTFVEAVEALADRFNFKLEYEAQDGSNRNFASGSLLKRLKMVHDQASRYYRKAFFSDMTDAKAVREYWVEKRGFSLEHAEEYGIGYAPPDGGAFFQFLIKQSFSEKELEASGLFFPRGNSTRNALTARFRGRLMVPICDLTGQVIAFTGRKLDQTPTNDPAFEAKYVNSPKTDLFNKGTLLFGIHIARKVVSEERPFVMVEGQLDAVRCWTEGFEQVVATQGTAITDIQLGKLKNYCSRLIMCLDGDAAGTKAAIRVLPMALAAGLDLRFIRLEKGDDPDTYLGREGRDAFNRLLEQSTPVIPFLIESFFDSSRRDAASLARSAEHCFEMISQSNSEIVKGRMLEELANGVGLDARTMGADFQKFQQKKNGRTAAPRPVPLGTKATPPGQKLRTAESDLLQMVIQNPAIRSKMSETDFTDLIDPSTTEGALLMRICAELREDPAWTPETDADLVCSNEQEHNLIYQLLAGDPLDAEVEDQFAVCMKSIQLRYDKRRLRAVEHKLNRANSLSDEEMNNLFMEKLQLQKRIANHTTQH